MVYERVLPAIASALHVLGIALVCTFSTLRLIALRKQDVPGTRLADNMGFYTANPVFWVKLGAVGVMVALELYPQYVVLPWHIRHGRKRPIEPKPGQFERMFKLCVLQLPCIAVVIVCAALMARGVGLPAAAPPAAAAAASALPGAAVYATYCQTCHQADGRGLGGKAAGDFVGDAAILAQPDAALLETIARGKTGKIGTMPGWGNALSEQQRRDVLAYIRATFSAVPATAPR
jgi:mono/diheme cytochrome c family protein